MSSGGIIILRDTQSDQPETLVETVKGNAKEFLLFFGFIFWSKFYFIQINKKKKAGGPVKEEEESEPEPPEPFEWIDE